MKSWNLEVFGKLNLQVREAVRDMIELDNLLVSDVASLNYEVIEKRLRHKLRCEKDCFFGNPCLEKNQGAAG